MADQLRPEGPRYVRYEVDGAIARIILDRPDRLNAIVDPMLPQLREAVERADADPAVHVAILFAAVPAAQLDTHVEQVAARIASVPRSQLALAKTVVNQAYEAMGLSTTQLLATLFDGIARHSPEGVAFKQRVEQVGWRQAVAERDRGSEVDGT